MKRVVLVVAFYTIIASALLPIREYDGDSLVTRETVKITVGLNPFVELLQPGGCALNIGDNYDPMENGVAQGQQTHVRYYIKKRLAVQPGGGAAAALLRYHFIASRRPLYRPIANNPNMPNIELPEAASLSVPHREYRPNEFDSQLGWIYCGSSTLSDLQIRREFTYIERRNSAKNCGIQQILVKMCVEDPDVNRYLNNPRYLNPGFAGDTPKSDLNLREIFVARDRFHNLRIGNEVYASVQLYCKRFVAVKKTVEGRGINTVEINMRSYLRPLLNLRFTRTIYLDQCDFPIWRPCETQHLLSLRAGAFNEIFQNTDQSPNWYFCSMVNN